MKFTQIISSIRDRGATPKSRRLSKRTGTASTIALIVGLSFLSSVPAQAANKAGGPCATLSAKASIAGDHYICLKDPTTNKPTWVLNNVAGGPCATFGDSVVIGRSGFRCDSDPRTGKLAWTVPAAAGKRGGNLRVALPALPATIDPYATSLQSDWVIARNVCEPLFDVSTSYAIKPVLADSFTYDGKLTYVIKLRSGVSFQDKEPLTSADVVSSLKRFVLTPGNGAGFKSILDSAVAVDPLTVQLNLKTPSPLVSTYLTAAFIMPASIQDGQSATKPVAKLICTGPFTVGTFIPGQKIVLNRWAGYKARKEAPNGATGKKVAFVNSVTFTPIGAESTRVQALQTGLVDVANVSLDSWPALKNSTTVLPMVMDASSSPCVIFNKISGIMSNVKMRQAVAAALDFGDILASAYGDPNYYSVEGSIFPKGNQWYSNAGLTNYNVHNAAKVKKLLDDAGYKGEKIVWMTTKEDPAWYGPAVPAQQQLAKYGINVELRVTDRATIIANRSDPSKFDMFSSAIPVYVDPIILPYMLDSFAGGWISPTKTSLMAQFASGTDFKSRKASWDALQTLIYTEVPFIKFGTIAPGVIAVNSKFYMDQQKYNGLQYFFNVYQKA